MGDFWLVAMLFAALLIFLRTLIMETLSAPSKKMKIFSASKMIGWSSLTRVFWYCVGFGLIMPWAIANKQVWFTVCLAISLGFCAIRFVYAFRKYFQAVMKELSADDGEAGGEEAG